MFCHAYYYFMHIIYYVLLFYVFYLIYLCVRYLNDFFFFMFCLECMRINLYIYYTWIGYVCWYFFFPKLVSMTLFNVNSNFQFYRFRIYTFVRCSQTNQNSTNTINHVGRYIIRGERRKNALFKSCFWWHSSERVHNIIILCSTRASIIL